MANKLYKVGEKSGKSCACCGETLVTIEQDTVQDRVWTGPDEPVDQITYISTGQHPTRKCVFCLDASK